MIPKSKGAEDKCPSCQQTLVCREVEYKGDVKLQWQYKDKEVAHFSYDFKTKKSACKESSEGSEASTAQPKDSLNVSGIDIDEKQALQIVSESEDATKRLLLCLSAVTRECNKAGITHPASIGMIFNQVCAGRLG